MTPEQTNQLIAGAVAVGLALMAFLAAALNSKAREIAAHVAVVVRTGVQAAAGAGAAPRYPRWNQLADPLPDGTLPAGRYDECGEECCSMLIYAQHGVPTPADYLRYELGGPGRPPLTTAADLVRILGLCNVPSSAELVGADQVAGRLQRVTAAPGAAIALGTWIAPGILHWILVTRADTAGCGANDPWGGRRRIWTWEEFRRAYAGELVVVTRQPDAR